MSTDDEYARQTEEDHRRRRCQEILCRDVLREALPNLAALASWAAGARDAAAAYATSREPPFNWDTLSNDLRKSILEQLPDARLCLDEIEAAMKAGDE